MPTFGPVGQGDFCTAGHCSVQRHFAQDRARAIDAALARLIAPIKWAPWRVMAVGDAEAPRRPVSGHPSDTTIRPAPPSLDGNIASHPPRRRDAGLYSSLNCGYARAISPTMCANRRRAAAFDLAEPSFDRAPDHSTDARRRRATLDSPGAPKADALVTDWLGVVRRAGRRLRAGAAGRSDAGVIGAPHAG
jgi:hypothetical protein